MEDQEGQVHLDQRDRQETEVRQDYPALRDPWVVEVLKGLRVNEEIQEKQERKGLMDHLD